MGMVITFFTLYSHNPCINLVSIYNHWNAFHWKKKFLNVIQGLIYELPPSFFRSYGFFFFSNQDNINRN